MAKVGTDHSNTEAMRQHQLLKKGSQRQESLIHQEVDLSAAYSTSIFNEKLTLGMNSREPYSLNRVLYGKTDTDAAVSSSGQTNSSSSSNAHVFTNCLISDTDSQMLIRIIFNEKVNLSMLKFRACLEDLQTECALRNSGVTDPDDEIDCDEIKRPRTVKIFVNNDTLDFSDYEDNVAATDVVLADEEDTKIPLTGPKYQRVQTLTILIEDAQEEGDYTYLNKIVLMGHKCPEH